MGELWAVLMALWNLATEVVTLLALGVWLGWMLGLLEVHQSESLRQARAGWRAGKGRRR